MGLNTVGAIISVLAHWLALHVDRQSINGKIPLFFTGMLKSREVGHRVAVLFNTAGFALGKVRPIVS